MKKAFVNFLSLTAILLVVLSASSVFAQVGNPPGGGGNPPTGGGNPVDVKVVLNNPFSLGDDLYTVAKGIVENLVLPIGGILCVLAFIYAGFMYVTAGGDTTKIKDANNMLLYAAIGTAVLLGAWALAEVVRSTINQLTT